MKIVGIDDSPFVHAIIKDALSECDVVYEEYWNGAEALNALMYGPPDLLLVDLHLPVVCGIDLIGKIRSLKSFDRTPILVISGEITKEKLVQLMHFEVRDFICKPFTNFEILRKIEKLLPLPRRKPAAASTA